MVRACATKWRPAEVLQRASYTERAATCDQEHSPRDEHRFAAAWLASAVGFHGRSSLLDVGAGMGRLLPLLRRQLPDIRYVGIEPAHELRCSQLISVSPVALLASTESA